MSPTPPESILLFTAARTASHLFIKMMLSGQDPEKLTQTQYYFAKMLSVMSNLWENDINSEECPEKFRQQIWQMESQSVINTMKFYHQAISKNIVGFKKEHTVFALRPEFRYSGHPLQLDARSNANAVMEPLMLHYNQSDRRTAQGSNHEAPLQNGKAAIDSFPPSWTNSPSTNVTVLPDALLQAIKPVFLIRHPSLMFPSFVRVTSQDEKLRLHLSVPSLLWTRLLFDWYCACDQRYTQGQQPIIVDAADMMQSAEFRQSLARTIGLDPERITTDWKAETKDELATRNAMSVHMTQSLSASTGVDLSKAGHGQSETFDKWEKEFGRETAEMIQRRVDEETPHWEYLHSRRFVMREE